MARSTVLATAVTVISPARDKCAAAVCGADCSLSRSCSSSDAISSFRRRFSALVVSTCDARARSSSAMRASFAAVAAVSSSCARVSVSNRACAAPNDSIAVARVARRFSISPLSVSACDTHVVRSSASGDAAGTRSSAAVAAS
ncbi:uncharacterized protein MICPUCDRAFT_38820 [Micromonas pusilla CCMP1545]|uniref:Predicted protein n=1 Tax=Micromonas pusilla (strain CCMP1545) TaxID=564608 RepID=C1MM54_MICPC|nr:uncharacterized protein MICPUCDRAFT_38820 [Micromonas pusilla CCMP1545]EEH58984.1 predicted protein [Micromonas pusilla CCMP1545]|eukprot:XP_003057339.1 predicted protein [Micromonas pusilla CCMP1545]